MQDFSFLLTVQVLLGILLYVRNILQNIVWELSSWFRQERFHASIYVRVREYAAQWKRYNLRTVPSRLLLDTYDEIEKVFISTNCGL